MTAKELKASILQLAVTGKLVPQDPNDEPASVLLERIKAEKAKLVKAGKIKKDKNPSEIVTGSDGAVYEKFKDGTAKDISDELPSEIPGGWAWVRLTDICETIADCPHTTAKDEGVGFPLVRTANIGEGRLIYEGMHRVSKEVYDKRNSRAVPKCGDLIFAREAPAGNIAVIQEGELVCLGQRTVLISPIREIADSDFIAFYILSPAIQTLLVKKSLGATVAHVNLKDIRPFLIPLPPLAEQKRIVAKIEKLMPLVEEYGKMEETRLQLDADLPAMLEKSILQEAIQGKLVPQDPNDEPASELLKRIAAERKALVKAGKLKRDKSEAVIFRGSDRLAYETRNGETVCIQDEIPFEIPDSWEWVRLGDILHPMTSKKPSGETFDYIDIDAIDNRQHIIKAAKTLQTKGATSRASREVKSGDVLFSMVRPYLRNIALIDECYAHCIASTGFYVCRPSDVLYPPYLYHLILSDYVVMGLNESMKGLNSPGITTGDLQRFPIPLPPLAEQKRIVVKIEKLRTAIKSFTT